MDNAFARTTQTIVPAIPKSVQPVFKTLALDARAMVSAAGRHYILILAVIHSPTARYGILTSYDYHAHFNKKLIGN